MGVILYLFLVVQKLISPVLPNIQTIKLCLEAYPCNTEQ